MKPVPVQRISDESELYPPLLREAGQPPKELFVWGDVKLLSRAPLLAVVGSRRASVYGRRCVERLLKGVVQAGVPLVSGLAYGIDSAAHRLCLECGVPTVAVLGSGLDEASIYPKSNISLAHQIVAAGGAVVSEYPDGTPAYPSHFPERNRIIAGLSAATIVVQAAVRSGSLITARLSLEAGREVAAVPGQITDELAGGTNMLIRDGAMPLLEPQDVFDLLGIASPVREERVALTLTAVQQQVLEQLSDAPQHIDVLVEKTRLAAPAVSVTLTELELLEAVEQVGGMKYVKK